jgi:very-short-patch-repair endonuclease
MPVAGEKSTLDADRRVAHLAATEWGVLSLEELRACGLTSRAVEARVRRGWLHAMYRRVYAVGHPNPPRPGLWLAAVKACGRGALLSHFSATVLWELLEWDHRTIEVTVTGSASRRHRGIRVHRTRWLLPAERARCKGVPVTSVIRTLIDLAAVADYKLVRRAVREAVARGLVDLAELVAASRAARGRRGIRKLARVVATSGAPTRTVLEDVVLDLMLAGGLAHPEVNKPMYLDGRKVVPDFRWPGVRVIVEADGAVWHDHLLAREDDAERQALLEAHGERVIRVTWDQAVRRPDETLARLRAAAVPLAPPSVT